MSVVVLSNGLAGSLVALAIRKQLPEQDLLLIDIIERPYRKYPLIFCDLLVPEQHRWLIEPLIIRTWQSFYFATAHESGRIAGRVSVLSDQQLNAELFLSLDVGQYLRCDAIIAIHDDHVILANGSKIFAKRIFDARRIAEDRTFMASTSNVTVRDYTCVNHHKLDAPLLLSTPSHVKSSCVELSQVIPLSENLLRIVITTHVHDRSPTSEKLTLPSASESRDAKQYSKPFLLSAKSNEENLDAILRTCLAGEVGEAFQSPVWSQVCELLEP